MRGDAAAALATDPLEVSTMSTIITDSDASGGPPRSVCTTDVVRLTNCSHCWPRPGKPCTITGGAR
jgi:hypothetical protein